MINFLANHRNILKWLGKKREHDFQCSVIVAEDIFDGGDFEMLDWIFENKIPICVDVCISIVRQGRRDVLKKVRSYGCKWNYKICNTAMHLGYVDIVRWAQKQGFSIRTYQPALQNLKFYDF